MSTSSVSQRSKLRDLFSARTIMRAHELRAAGIGAETIARAVRSIRQKPRHSIRQRGISHDVWIGRVEHECTIVAPTVAVDVTRYEG